MSGLTVRGASPELRSHAAMLGFSALVAGSFSLGKLAIPFIDPVAFNAVRFVIAAAAMWGLAWASGGITRKALAAPWRYFMLAALFVFYFVMMFEGLKTAQPVSLAAVFTLNPALTAMFGYLVVRQVTTGWMALAIAVGGVGALWVIFDGDLDALRRFEIGTGETLSSGAALPMLCIPRCCANCRAESLRWSSTEAFWRRAWCCC